ncbi:MAG: hypothetical protein ACQEQ0_08310, partial [Bacteroidota bacterium]
MKSWFIFFSILMMILALPTGVRSASSPYIDDESVDATIQTLSEKYPSKADAIEKGVKHLATLWREKDGDRSDFHDFCLNHYVADEQERSLLLEKVSRNLEILQGHFNQISLKLKEPLHLPMGDITAIDESFGGFSASSHLDEDLYSSKIGFQVALN